MEELEYYKLIRNSIQLQDVRLLSLEFRSNDWEKERPKSGISLQIHRSAQVLDERRAEINLQVGISFKEDKGPFNANITYGGLCVATQELNEEEFKEYVYEQVVPLLLPYVRECVSSTLAKMRLPIFYLPTIDVLETLKKNKIKE